MMNLTHISNEIAHNRRGTILIKQNKIKINSNHNTTTKAQRQIEKSQSKINKAQQKSGEMDGSFG